MMANKVDVEVTVSPEVESQARGLRVGGTVYLARCSDNASVTCSAHPPSPAPAQTPAESSAASQQQQPVDDAAAAQQPAAVGKAATDRAEGAGPAAFGTIGAEAGATLPPGAATGTVRSIRRAAGSQTVTHVTVRVVAPAAGGAAQGQPPPLAPALWSSGPPDDEELQSMRLPLQKLEHLSSSVEVRSQVKDIRLQDVIRQIDAAHNPEQALEKALLNPHFDAFCTKVLDVLG